MTPDGIAQRAARIVEARRPTVRSRDQIADALRATEQSIAWFEAQRAGLIRQLSTVESCPEQTIADTSRCGLGKAGKTKERSDTLADTPTLADALEDGAITAGHVDAVTRGKKKLDSPAEQQEFLDRVEDLVDEAAGDTIDQYGRRLDREIKLIQRGNGEDRLVRQKKMTRLRHWVDEDGMWNLRGRFDPVAALGLSSKLDHAVEQLFAKQTPEHCPTDPIEKQQFLYAHALVGLLGGKRAGGAPASEEGGESDSGSDCGSGTTSAGGSGSGGRPEFVAVIDIDAEPGRGPLISLPIPVELPPQVLLELYPDADVHAVIVRNGVVLHARGKLNLGRTTRLANRAQRRSLRALYSCCAVPGCSVGFDRCKIHHIIWWRNGGRTDLDNLLPVCARHHSQIHSDDWTITLGPNRELSIRLPDGRIMTTGPPRRSAA